MGVEETVYLGGERLPKLILDWAQGNHLVDIQRGHWVTTNSIITQETVCPTKTQDFHQQ